VTLKVATEPVVMVNSPSVSSEMPATDALSRTLNCSLGSVTLLKSPEAIV
jgi:hypothetical protein